MKNPLRTLSYLFLCAGFSVSQAGELKWDPGKPDVITLQPTPAKFVRLAGVRVVQPFGVLETVGRFRMFQNLPLAARERQGGFPGHNRLAYRRPFKQRSNPTTNKSCQHRTHPHPAPHVHGTAGNSSAPPRSPPWWAFPQSSPRPRWARTAPPHRATASRWESSAAVRRDAAT